MKKRLYSFVLALTVSAVPFLGFAKAPVNLKYGLVDVFVTEGSLENPKQFFKVKGDSLYAVFPKIFSDTTTYRKTKYFLTVQALPDPVSGATLPAKSIKSFDLIDLCGKEVCLCSTKKATGITIAF